MKRGGGSLIYYVKSYHPPPLLPQLKMNGSLAEEISIGNSTICSFPSEMDAPLCIGAHQQHDNIFQKEVNAIKT